MAWTLGDLMPEPPKKRRTPPKSVKGRDVELYAEDGQRVDAEAQRAFTPHAPKKKAEPPKWWWERLRDGTPYEKAAKTLKKR